MNGCTALDDLSINIVLVAVKAVDLIVGLMRLLDGLAKPLYVNCY